MTATGQDLDIRLSALRTFITRVVGATTDREVLENMAKETLEAPDPSSPIDLEVRSLIQHALEAHRYFHPGE